MTLFSYTLIGQEIQISQPIRMSWLDSTEESAPFYDELNQQLYFVRTFSYFDRTGVKKHNQDSWKGRFNTQTNSLEKLVSLDEVNHLDNNILCGLSSDGKRMYFFHSKGIYGKNAGLFVYDQINGKLKNKKKIVIPGLDISATNTIGFFMHPDETSLLISYQGQESIGMEDNSDFGKRVITEVEFVICRLDNPMNLVIGSKLCLTALPEIQNWLTYEFPLIMHLQLPSLLGQPWHQFLILDGSKFGIRLLQQARVLTLNCIMKIPTQSEMTSR